MNYKEINTAILEGRDVDTNRVKKNEAFYKYLFNNKVAYYYAFQLSENKTEKEEWIVKRGNELNKKYIRTLEYIKVVCDNNNIPFILFKTHKVIPEVVDGDIDLIVKEIDFQRFLDIFTQNGFDCIEDEPGKGKCLKDGYNVIEPHITISWRGNSYFDGEELWQFTESVTINNRQYTVSDKELEVFISVAQLFYEPEYIDLYTMFILKSTTNLLQKIPNYELIELFLDDVHLRRNVIFPIFAPFGLFTIIWTKELFASKNLKIYILHWIFYIYWRARYNVNKNLPFVHIW